MLLSRTTESNDEPSYEPLMESKDAWDDTNHTQLDGDETGDPDDLETLPRRETPAWYRAILVRWRAIAILSITSAVIAAASHVSSSPAIRQHLAETIAPASGTFGASVGGGWCVGDEYLQGSWRVRDGGVWKSREELNAGYDIKQGHTHYDHCWAPGEEITPVISPEHLNRILTAASYEWRPDSGCPLIPLDRVEMVTRLLQSYHGLWMVGDSLTDAHFAFVEHFLCWPGGPVSMTDIYGHLPLGQKPLNRSLNFDPNHPDAEFYLRRAGVPRERLGRSLVHLARNDHLLLDSEMQDLMTSNNGPEFPGTTEDYPQMTWLDRLAASSAAHDKIARRGIYQPTALMISSGAHWNTGLLNMTAGGPIHTAYEMMAKHVFDLVTSMDHVDLFVRTVAPGHPDCADHSEPDHTYKFPAAGTPAAARADKYGWSSFKFFNEVWKDLLDAYQAKGGPPRTVYMNTRPIDIQRPDVHVSPPLDCLHHCMPSIQYQWTKLFYHEWRMLDMIRRS